MSSALYTIIITVCMITSPDGGRTTPPCKDLRMSASLDQMVGDVPKEVPGENDQTIFSPLGTGERDKRNLGGVSPFLCQHAALNLSVSWLNANPLWRLDHWSCPSPRKKGIDS